MLRLLLLGIVLTTLGVGIRKGWIEIHWERVRSDLGVPARVDDKFILFRSYSKPSSKPRQAW